MKNIMIIGAGEFQVPLIKQCKKDGYKVIVTDINSNAKGFKYADIPLNIDTLDKKSSLQAAIKYNIDAILTTSDYPVRTVAYICEKMNLYGLTVKAAEICTNKFLLREQMRTNGIRTPKYWSACNYEKAKNILNRVKFPIIVKPVDSSASRGVSKVNNKTEFKMAFEEAFGYSKSGLVLVEEFIGGNEYSVETLTQYDKTYVIAITEKTTTGSPYFIEERHVVPADLNEEQNEKISNLILKTIKVIGINNSSSHIELKYTDKGPVIIEVAARLGGDYITSDLVPLATGVNMLENIIKISLGEDIDYDSYFHKYAGIQFITPINYNSIINYREELSNVKNVLKMNLLNKEDNMCFKSSFDRLGYYICVGDSREEVISILDIYK